MKIIIPFKAISVNDAYYGNKKYGMKADAKDWCYQVNWILVQYKSQFELLRSQFNPKEHGLCLEIEYHYKDFYNKNGEISSKVFDLTNNEKILVDLIVDARHYGPPPYKSPNLNINDKHVTKIISQKMKSDSDKIEIKISLLKLNDNAGF